MEGLTVAVGSNVAASESVGGAASPHAMAENDHREAPLLMLPFRYQNRFGNGAVQLQPQEHMQKT